MQGGAESEQHTELIGVEDPESTRDFRTYWEGCQMSKRV